MGGLLVSAPVIEVEHLARTFRSSLVMLQRGRCDARSFTSSAATTRSGHQ